MSKAENIYRGVRFRTAAEMRWAMLFDLLGVKWLYAGGGKRGDVVVPTFKLTNVDGMRTPPDGVLHVAVVPDMDMDDEVLGRISDYVHCLPDPFGYLVNPMLVVDTEPGRYLTPEQVPADIERDYPQYYNYTFVDGDDFPCFLGVDRQGRTGLFSGTRDHQDAIDRAATTEAYLKAFEGLIGGYSKSELCLD